MYHIAYDLETKKILAFINTEDKINEKEIFAGLDNYDVISTNEEPPLFQYTDYKINLESNNIIFEKEEIKTTEVEIKNQELLELKGKLKDTNDILLEFLEGDLTITEYATTKTERKRLKSEIKKLEAEIHKMKGE